MPWKQTTPTHELFFVQTSVSSDQESSAFTFANDFLSKSRALDSDMANAESGEMRNMNKSVARGRRWGTVAIA